MKCRECLGGEMETDGKLCVVAVWILSLASLIALGLGLFLRAPAFSATNGSENNDPVVLELFTSESCSSCPPADALLSKLGSSANGVIPLAYHVDYWNHLGWSDPFSSRQWTDRQSAYALALDTGGNYTPQLVVNGGWQSVGSDSGSIAREVAAARSTPAAGRVSL